MGYKMDYQTFQQEIKQLVEEGLRENGDYTCSMDTLQKNNVSKTGLLISETGKDTTMTVYLDQLYEEYLKGEPLSEISSQIVGLSQKNKMPDIAVSELKDYGKMKDKLRIHLVGREQNGAYLEQGPYKVHPIGAEIVYAELKKTGAGTLETRVTHSLLQEWGVPESEIFGAALENSQKEERVRFCSLMSEVSRITGMEIPEEETSDKDMIYILSNQSRNNGAAVLLYPEVLEEVHGKMGGDFYILPSSIHEVLVVSMECSLTPEELRNMVREVNRAEVRPEERLGNEVYEFRGETGTLQKCKIAEKEMTR